MNRVRLAWLVGKTLHWIFYLTFLAVGFKLLALVWRWILAPW